jgi:hypothetical protein
MVRVAVNNTQSCIEMTARSTIIIEGAAQRSNLFRNRIRVTLVAVQQAKRGGFRKRIMQGLSAWNCYNFEHAITSQPDCTLAGCRTRHAFCVTPQ